jgi:hypothetical protein
MLSIFGFIGTLGLRKSDSFRMSLARDFLQEPIFWPTDGQQNVKSSIFWIIAAAAVDKRQRLSWDMAAVRPQIHGALAGQKPRRSRMLNQ